MKNYRRNKEYPKKQVEIGWKRTGVKTSLNVFTFSCCLDLQMEYFICLKLWPCVPLQGSGIEGLWLIACCLIYEITPESATQICPLWLCLGMIPLTEMNSVYPCPQITFKTIQNSSLPSPQLVNYFILSSELNIFIYILYLHFGSLLVSHKYCHLFHEWFLLRLVIPSVVKHVLFSLVLFEA